MSFDTALGLVSILGLFILACTMANLLARITRLERFAQHMVASTTGPTDATAMSLPAEVARVTKGQDPARLLFVSADCSACDEAVELIGRWPEEARRSTFLVYRDEPADDFVAPPGIRVVPHATALFRALSVASTPTAIHVEAGLVAHRAAGLPTADPGGHAASTHAHANEDTHENEDAHENV